MATCALFGHRELSENINMALMSALERLVCTYAVDVFYVGYQGAFDRAALCALCVIARKYPHVQYAVALAYLPPPPYLAGEPTVVPEGLENVPKRYAISFRNKWMLDKTDFLLVYKRHSRGGTARMVDSALRARKAVINIAGEYPSP